MWFSIQEQLIRRKMKRFRGGLVFQAQRLVYHSTLGSRLTEKKEKKMYFNICESGQLVTPEAPPALISQNVLTKWFL